MRAVAFCLALLSAGLVSAADVNVALGKPYRFLKPANYRFCADPADMKQLTDGVYAPTGGQLWVKKECVGWSIGKGEGLVTVTVDLGETKALGGFSWHYAAGVAGVGWPSVIFVYASEDGRTWDCVGDLLAMSTKRDGGPQVDRYRDYRAWSDAMSARGRYVTFAVRSETYIFCDELEVYAGDPAQAAAAHAAAHKVASPVRHLFGFQVRDGLRRRDSFDRRSGTRTAGRTSIRSCAGPRRRRACPCRLPRQELVVGERPHGDGRSASASFACIGEVRI